MALTGAACRNCRRTEQACAYRQGCCDGCSHWVRYDSNGNDRLSAAAGRRRLPVEHATERGYHQHRVRGELPCQPCRAAHSLTVGRRKAS